jgi:DNA-binding NarL/FixJ family response regulator
LLEARPDWQVVAESGSCVEACALARALTPDVTLLDLHLGEDNVVEQIPAILDACATTRILVLTADHSIETHERAVTLGAMGVVLKDHAAAVLLDAVNAVASGSVWLDATLAARTLENLRPVPAQQSEGESENKNGDKISRLTMRERQVIAVVCEGLRNQDIATRLFISEATVRHHLTSVFSKLDVSGRFELIVYANRHGLTKITA